MIPACVRIFVCTEPQDMRRCFDPLALAARQALGEDPRSGALFCFVNKRANRLKILWFDGTGCCLLYKRAHGVRFVLPPHVKTSPDALGGLIEPSRLRDLVTGVRRVLQSGRRLH
jgi:transposase